jgi:putative transposase
MGRLSRNIVLYDGCITHKTWHAHNDEYNLEQPIDKEDYLKILFNKISSQACSIHAYSVMGNHSHELYTVNRVHQFSNFMRIHHTIYGQRFNLRNDRKGKVANERPTTTLIKDVAHEIISTLYIHSNIFKVDSIKNPEDFEWSTHHLYAHGIKNTFTQRITLPEWYLNLGDTDEERQKSYRQLFNAYLFEPNELVSEIHHQTKTCG